MVFKTIVENVKSFFEKEEELEHEPKKAPDAAIELYEKPMPKEHEIVEHRLPKSGQLGAASPVTSSTTLSSSTTISSAASSSDKTSNTLPFSSAELRERLRTRSTSSTAIEAGAAQSSSTRTASQHPQTSEDLSSQIAEFEQVIGALPVDDASDVAVTSSSSSPASTGGVSPGFFSRLADELTKRGYDAAALEGVVERMKEHHAEQAVVLKQQQELASLEREVSQVLAELQGLEREWAAKREEAAAAQERMAALEVLIGEKSDALKVIVERLRQRAEQGVVLEKDASAQDASVQGAERPLRQAPRPPVSPAPVAASAERPAEGPGLSHPFILADGRRLTSISELREALRTMDDELFYHHVAPGRNDFAAWIRDVFGKEELASRVQHVASRFALVQLLAQETET